MLRIKQWSKNLFIFIPLIFTSTLFTEAIFPTIIGFIALCFLSSGNYIINDIIDKKKDQLHPEKKKRLIASNKMPTEIAIIIAIVMFTTAFFLATSLPASFTLILISLFVITTFYSLFLKNERFLDVIIIGINFLLRTMAGAFIINAVITGWLVVGIFFFALLFGFAKREGDLTINAENTKPVLKEYTLDQVKRLKELFGVALILTYGLYALQRNIILIVTIPIFVYGVLEFLYLKNPILYRHPEMLYKNPRLLISGVLFVGLTVLLLGQSI